MPPKRFIQLVSAALTAGLLIWGIDYMHCIDAHACFLMTDFKVVYRPAAALISGNVAGVYDIAMIERWMADGGGTFFHPTLYPPYSLFFFYPLGLLPPLLSGILWFSLQIIVLILVLRMREVRVILGSFPPFYSAVFFLPFCAYALVLGQVALLTTALFLLVLVWRRSHPIWAGLAFGLLCLKPQMALPLAILLLQEKNGKALATIAAYFLVTITASLMLWGQTIWLDYMKITALSGMILSSALPVYTTMMSSIFSSAQMLGGSEALARTLQLLVTGMVAITLFLSLKRCADDTARLMLLAPAAFLLSPYSFVYDTLLLAPICVILGSQLLQGKGSLPSRILLIALLLLPLLAITLQRLHIPYAMLAIVSAYLYALHHARTSPPA